MLICHPGDYEVWSDGSRDPRSIHYHKALYRVIRGAVVPEGWVRVATVEQTMEEPRYWGLKRLEDVR